MTTPATLESKLTQDLCQLYQSKALADFVLISKDGQEFNVHRSVLASRSKVFTGMFMMKDSKENKTGRCDVDDVDGETLDVLLRFMYGCNTNNTAFTEDAGKVLVAADKYDFAACVPVCVATLKSQLKADNAGDILVLGDRYKLDDLKTTAMGFIMKNLPDFLRAKQLEVVRDHCPNLLDTLLKSITVGTAPAASTVPLPSQWCCKYCHYNSPIRCGSCQRAPY